MSKRRPLRGRTISFEICQRGETGIEVVEPTALGAPLFFEFLTPLWNFANQRLVSILNLSGYRFVSLEAVEALRDRLYQLGSDRGIKGSILLAKEGINAFLAGPVSSVEAFAEDLRKFSEFENLEFQKTWSKSNPFKKFFVRVKREIVTIRCPEIDPINDGARRIDAEDFKKLLDQGEDLIVLDARKDFEYRMGHFQGAINLKLDHFSRFPEVLQSFPEEWKKKKIVTYCTGGIRCEKAAPLMRKHGFENVLQLEGGILKYFEKCQGEHFEGSCFVFDHRVAVNKNLEVVKDLECRSCRGIIERSEENLVEPGLLQLCARCQEENPSCPDQ